MPRNSQRDAEDEPCKAIDQELIDSLNAQLTQANTKIDRLCEALLEAADIIGYYVKCDCNSFDSTKPEKFKKIVKEIKDNK